MSVLGKVSEFFGLSSSGKTAPTSPVASATRTPARVTPIKPRRSSGDMSEIFTVELTSYANCQEVSDAFREGVPVIVNMGGMSEAEAKRMLDYMLGLKEGLYGHLRRVTNKVWLLTPSNISVNDEDETNPGEADDLLVQP
jgi:cell division inhibitor SepF